ncbi:hypothetical protein [Nocardia salmonicida]|uniref:hypothetical protein n=1 Tax=Nocardia salmonicida TaxID=53431 RepID=UPI0007A5431E|nr:hypothetical protein [Nocardia salmonicida]MBC7299433.1 hypothetical protein [Nocardia sp.]
MPTIDIRRHGNDILIPYGTLTQLAGHTITNDHLDRLADRALPNSSLRNVLGTVLDSLLTPDEFNQVHEELGDPFAGQAPPRAPAPCEGRDAAVLAALRAIQIEHDGEPFIVGDSDAATARDLAYLDRLIEALDLGGDEAPAPTPQYNPDQHNLYRALLETARAHVGLDVDALTQIHGLVAALTPDTGQPECDCPAEARHLISHVWVPHQQTCPHAEPRVWIWAIGGVPRTGILARYAQTWKELRANGTEALAELSTELRTWDGHRATVTISEDHTSAFWEDYKFRADRESTTVRIRVPAEDDGDDGDEDEDEDGFWPDEHDEL